MSFGVGKLDKNIRNGKLENWNGGNWKLVRQWTGTGKLNC